MEKNDELVLGKDEFLVSSFDEGDVRYEIAFDLEKKGALKYVRSVPDGFDNISWTAYIFKLVPEVIKTLSEEEKSDLDYIIGCPTEDNLWNELFEKRELTDEQKEFLEGESFIDLDETEPLFDDLRKRADRRI